MSNNAYPDPHRQNRIRGKRAIARALQEIAWANDLVIGRIDWTPDPEQAGTPSTQEAYLLTLLTDAVEVQERFTGTTLEEAGDPHRASLDPAGIKARLRPLIASLRSPLTH